MIPSRPLSLGGILDEAIRIIKQTYWRSALLLLIFCAPGMIISHIGVLSMIDGAEEIAERVTAFSPEAPRLIRDFVFSNTRQQHSANRYFLYFQYKGLFTAIDSAETSLRIQYPDSASRNAIVTKLDSIARAFKAQPDATIASTFFSHIGVGAIIFLVGIVLYILGSIGSSAAQYDLASRTFEERSLDFPPIISLSLRKNLWYLIAQYFIIAFAMLTGLGMVIGITFVISTVLGVLGVLLGFGIIFYAIFRILFSTVALVSEELGPLDSIKRSLELTKGSFWRVMGIVIICGLLISTVGTLLRLPFNFLLAPDLRWLLEFIRGGNFNIVKTFSSIRSAFYSFEALTLISALLTASLSPAYITTFYYDLRTRREGELEYHADEPHTPEITPPEELQDSEPQ